MARFRYPTRLADYCIRLVRFAKDTDVDNDNLRLEIVEFDLVTTPTFHALSYTWGPPSPDDPEYTAADAVPISLNEQEFEVLPNLFDALSHLKRADYSEYYWVDAICINQDDFKERENQVSIMDRIYMSAEQVDIWLGKSGPYGNEVMHMISQMAQISDKEVEQISASQQSGNIFDFENVEVMQRYGLTDIPEAVWEAFIDFFELRWFKRAWIVQEVVLSTRAAVMWNDEAIPWNVIASCSNLLVVSGMSRGLAELHSRRINVVSTVTQIGATPDRIQGLLGFSRGRSLSSEEELFCVLNRMSGFSENFQTSAHFLLLCILIALPFKSTDERDKIYSLLGIMNQISENKSWEKMTLQPDYGPSSSPALAFTAAAVAIMSDCNHIGLLTAVSDESIRSVEGLPSWVPNFPARGTNAIANLTKPSHTPQFDPSRSQTSGAQTFHFEGQKMYVRGFRAGCVTGTSDPCLDMVNYGRFEQAASLLVGCAPRYPFTGQDRIEVLWRTLIFDMDEYHHPALDELGVSFKSWLLYLVIKGTYLVCTEDGDVKEYISSLTNMDILSQSDDTNIVPSQQLLEQYSKKLCYIFEDGISDYKFWDTFVPDLQQRMGRFHTMAFSTLPYHCLFTTREGHIGMGPQSMRAGDSVWIISGCPSPLVLREVLTSDREPRVGEYKLLGECYVHGIMHGEAVEENTPWSGICLV